MTADCGTLCEEAPSDQAGGLGEHDLMIHEGREQESTVTITDPGTHSRSVNENKNSHD